jgi:hypothetical protein
MNSGPCDWMLRHFVPARSITAVASYHDRVRVCESIDIIFHISSEGVLVSPNEQFQQINPGDYP